MALSAEIVYTVQDNAGQESQYSIFIPLTYQMLDYIETARAIAGFVDEVIHGRFVTIAEICFGVDISGLVNNLEAVESDVEEIGEFIFETSEGRPTVVNIPAIREDIMLPNTHTIDQSNAQVAAFLTAMTTGVTFTPTDIAEVDIVNIRTAKERFRNSGSSK